MDKHTPEGWQSCSPGEIAHLGRSLRRRRQRRNFLKATGAVSTAALLALMGGVALSRRNRDQTPPPATQYAGITCSRVLELGPSFAAGTLDVELQDQIKMHLHDCRMCDDKYSRMSVPS